MILEGQISLFGYLWYIPFMLLAFVVLYALKRIVNNEKWFIFILVSFVALSYFLLYFPVLEKWALFRALGGVSLGALLSYIPKINIKLKKFDLNWIITFVCLAVVIYLAYLPKENLVSEYFLVFLLMPALIYFTSTLTVDCKFFNFLGSLSFGFYAYQCVLRVIEFYTPLAQHWLFLILVALVMLDKLVNFGYKYYKKLKTKSLV